MAFHEKLQQKTFTARIWSLDGRNRAIVIAESLARVIATIRITSVRWRSYLLLENKENRPYPPGTKPIHTGKTSWRIDFFANTCQDPTCTKEELQVSDRILDRVLTTWTRWWRIVGALLRLALRRRLWAGVGRYLQTVWTRLLQAGGIADWPCK